MTESHEPPAEAEVAAARNDPPPATAPDGGGFWAPSPLDVKSLLHPSEYSRMLLALSASTIGFGAVGIIVFVAAGPIALAGVALVLLLIAAVVWATLQVVRARLLGQSVRVTAESLPEVQSVLDEVRARLDYHRPVDVYIAQSANPAVSVTSYLGTKIILLEGDLIGDLVRTGDRAQLTFLLARSVGALKARHERLTLVIVLLAALDALKLLNPFLLPYYRATTYSGDQIGQVCCGSADAALTATERLLVGKELEPSVKVVGIIGQAELVRRRWLPRLAQLMMAEPHLTGRYLNVLFFARSTDPGAWGSFHESLDRGTRDLLERLWAGSAHRRHGTRSSARRYVATAIAAGLTLAILGGVTALAVSATDRDAESTPTAPAGTAPLGDGEVAPPADEPAPPEPPAPSEPPPPAEAPAPPEPSPSPAGAEERLLEHVPASVRGSCETYEDTGATAAIASLKCEVHDAPVYYNLFGSSAGLNADWSTITSLYAGDATGARCQSGDYKGTWSSYGVTEGRLLCSVDEEGTAWIEWTHDELLIAARMLDVDGAIRALYRAWVEAGPE
jgi:hypothetical protein